MSSVYLERGKNQVFVEKNICVDPKEPNATRNPLAPHSEKTPHPLYTSSSHQSEYNRHQYSSERVRALYTSLSESAEYHQHKQTEYTLYTRLHDILPAERTQVYYTEGKTRRHYINFCLSLRKKVPSIIKRTHSINPIQKYFLIFFQKVLDKIHKLWYYIYIRGKQ